MPEVVLAVVLLLGIYNAVVVREVQRTARRLTDSVEVLVARSDLNHDQAMRNLGVIEKHDRQLTRLLNLQGLADD